MAGMLRYYRIWLLILALVVVAALGWHFRPQPLSRKVRLPDGTVLQVERITYGKRGTFRAGGLIELTKEKLAQWLPRVLSAKLVKPPPATMNAWSLVATVHTNLDALHIWLSRRDATNGFQPMNVFSAEFVDDDGHVFPATQTGGEDFGATWTAIPRVPGGGISSDVAWITFEAYPRREKRLRLRVFNQGGGPVADFLIANPTPDKAASNWVIEKLPIAKKDGDLTFTLATVAIKTNFSPGGTNMSRHPSMRPFELAPAFEISEGGNPSTNWDPVDLELWDSSGNCAVKPYYRANSVFLSPKESAWKLVVKFCGSENSPLATNAAVTLPPVAVPEAGVFLALNTNLNLQGISIKAGAVAGPGKVTYTQNGEPVEAAVAEGSAREGWSYPTGNNSPYAFTCQSSKPQLAVKIDWLIDNQWMTVRAVDDQGRESYARYVPQSGVVTDSGAPDSRYLTRRLSSSQVTFLTLDLAPDTKNVSLTFCLHSPRVAEFIFQPPHP